MESLEDRQVAQQLDAVEARLIERYREQEGVGEDRVRHTIDVVRSRFEGAAVRSFLPILIERAVASELTG
jgi:hypothetical protein